MVGFYIKGMLTRGVIYHLQEKVGLARSSSFKTKASNARASRIQKLRIYSPYSKN